MNELEKKEKEKQALEIKKVKNFFKILNTKEELDAWLYVYLDMRLPGETIYPGSNSSPLDVVWNIYKAVRDNEGKDFPGFILLSGRDCGKCVKKGTLLVTKDRNLCPIEQIKVGDEVWSGWNWQTVTETFIEGKKQGYNLVLDGGWELSGSENHRVWGYQNGKYGWHYLSDLSADGWVAIASPAPSNETLSQSDWDLGYMLGALTGDGCLTLMDKYRQIILTADDSGLKDKWYDFCIKNCGRKPSSSGGKRYRDYRISSKKMCLYLKSLGMKNSYSWEKQIPKFCLENKSAMLGFLSGVFDTDGSYSNNGGLIFSMTAKTLLKQMQVALQSLGVYSNLTIRNKLNGKQKHIVHNLYIPSHEMKKLFDVGLRFFVKKQSTRYDRTSIPDANDKVPSELLLSVIGEDMRHVRGKRRNAIIKPRIFHSMSNYPAVSRNKVREYIKWAEANSFLTDEKKRLLNEIASYRWKPVQEISRSKEEFFDISVDKDHSYWANGIINHNTVSASIAEALIMLHFGTTIAHMAAIRKQSEKATEYINKALNKWKKYYEANGWSKKTDNKTKMEFHSPDGKEPYLDVIIASLSGTNSSHTNIMCVDEIDVISDPRVLEEAKFIPSMLDGRYPLTVKLSTRKFAFGLMQRELEEAPKTGMRVLQWNFIDMTEKCEPDRYKPNSDGSMVSAFVAKDLPLRTITVDQASGMDETRLQEFEKVELYPGCLSCPLAPVCRGSLARRSTRAKGGFYKPIDMTIQKFKDTSPEVAAAQMLCLAPTSKGLIYPRFVDDPKDYNNSNTITVKQAYDRLVGENSVSEPTHALLMQEIVNLNLPINAGLDWGFTNEFSFAIFAEMPWGEVWMIDSFGQSELETDDKVAASLPYQEKYGVSKWWADTEDPSSRKTFTKKGMVCPDFKKDVSAGIESLRTLIVTSDGKRRLKIILPDEKDPDFMLVDNHRTVQFMKTHHFILDAQGNPTRKPADEKNGDKDRLDAMRYYAQNMHSAKGSRLLVGRDQKDKENRPESKLLPKKRTFEEDVAEHQAKLMQKVIKDSVKIDNSQPRTPKKRKGIVWNI